MRVNQLAKLLDITPDTVRFYTRINILSPVKSKSNGYKEYGQQDVSRLRFVLSARQLGFSVDDIRQILGEADKHESPCPMVRRIFDERMQEFEKQFQEMKRVRERMRAAVRDWDGKPDKEPTGHMICHLIESFASEHQEMK